MSTQTKTVISKQRACSRPPWITDLPTPQGCGQPVVPTGASVTHRSPADAFGLTRCACPGQRPAPPLRAAPGGPTPGLLETPFELPNSQKNRAGLESCATPTIQSAQRNSCTLRNRSRSTGISGHDHRNTQKEVIELGKRVVLGVGRIRLGLVDYANIVEMLGISSRALAEKMLISDWLPDPSGSSTLFDQPPLPWRIKIPVTFTQNDTGQWIATSRFGSTTGPTKDACIELLREQIIREC